jgi:GT2 family glycosyltransferase
LQDTAKAPLISVIILNYNGKKCLENCLSSVLASTYPNYEVILVDNASTDQSLKSVKAKFGENQRLKIIENQSNLGFSGGNNVGYSYSSGEYIAFLNNDTTVSPDWLTHLIKAFNDDETIGLAQSLILEISEEKIQNAGWLYSNYLMRMHRLGQNLIEGSQLKPVFEVSVASGASMMINRKLIGEFGLFEASMPFFYDDTLLSFKVWLANKRVVTVSASKIRHIWGATSTWTQKMMNFNLIKAKFTLIFDVYYKKTDLAKALFVNFSSMALHSILSLRKKGSMLPLAFFSASIWAIRNFRFLWQNRLNHWAKSKVSPKEIMEKMIRVSVPASFYLSPTKLTEAFLDIEINNCEKKLIFA